MSDLSAKLITTRRKKNQMEIALIGIVGETYIDVCECDGDEHELLITATNLVCVECDQHQPHYTN